MKDPIQSTSTPALSANPYLITIQPQAVNFTQRCSDGIDRKYHYVPLPDITPYELSRILELLLVGATTAIMDALAMRMTQLDYQSFIELHQLQRHFTIIESKSPTIFTPGIGIKDDLKV